MVANSSDGWHIVGEHAVRFEPPDIVHTRPGGDVSFKEGMALIDFIRDLPRPDKGFFGLVDMSKAGRQDPAIAKETKAGDYLRMQRAQAFYNATFYHRTMIGIFVRLSKLLKHAAPANAKIFTTEAEARAWIAETREKDV